MIKNKDIEPHKMSVELVANKEAMANLAERLVLSRFASQSRTSKRSYEFKNYRIERDRVLISDPEIGYASPEQVKKYGTTLAILNKDTGSEIFYAFIVEGQITYLRYQSPVASEHHVKDLKDEVKRVEERERSSQTGLRPIPLSPLILR